MSVACSMSAFKVPPEEALRRIAELGFEAVDLICIPGFGHLDAAALADDEDGYGAQVEAWLHTAGLTPVAVNCAFSRMYVRGDSGQNKERRRQMRAVTRLMRRLGVKVGSFFPGGREPADTMVWEDVLAGEVESARELMDASSEQDVRFGVELHANTPFETIEQGTRLLEALPELGVAYDPSHFAMQGINLEDTVPFLDRAIHVHLRDAAPGRMHVALGEGTVDFNWVLDRVRERPAVEHVSLEYLPAFEGDTEGELVQLLANVRQRLAWTS